MCEKENTSERKVLLGNPDSISIVIEAPDVSIKNAFTAFQDAMDFLESMRKDQQTVDQFKNEISYGAQGAYVFLKTEREVYREAAADFICTFQKLSDFRKEKEIDPFKNGSVFGLGNLTIIPLDMFTDQLIKDHPKYLRMYCSNANFFRNVFMALWITGIIEFCIKEGKLTGISIHDENLNITSGLKPFTL